MDESPALLRQSPTEFVDRLLEVATIEVGRAVVGHDAEVESLLIAILARGHILLEGPPGTAKTLLARALARAVGGAFHRVQFTPETRPSDVLGEIVRHHGVDEFERGPVFSNVFLADEINRAPARTQAALLEAMQERHVTMKGRAYRIEPPFVVIATQNPFEHEGVYPLAESQLDRFLVKIKVGYGSADEELTMLGLPHHGVVSDVIGEVFPFLADGGLLRLQELVDATTTPDDVAQRVIAIVRATRSAPGVELGASPRAAIHLLVASKARAVLRGRRATEVGDVEAVAELVLVHRIIAADPIAVVRHALITTR